MIKHNFSFIKHDKFFCSCLLLGHLQSYEKVNKKRFGESKQKCLAENGKKCKINEILEKNNNKNVVNRQAAGSTMRFHTMKLNE